MDEVVVFMFRMIQMLIRESRSRAWLATRADIVHVESDEALYPNVQFVYSYRVGEELYVGRYMRGFWYRASANALADCFRKTGVIVIRYEPSAPKNSYVHRVDQKL